MNWTKEELRKLRQSLPKTAIPELAEKFQLQPGSIRNILSGTPQNEDVILEAIKIAVEHKQFIELQKVTLNAL